MFFQPEPDGLFGVNPVAHGDKGVKIVVIQVTLDLPGALLANY